MPSKSQATKLKPDFTDLLLAEVLVGKGAGDLKEKLKKPKEEGREVIASVRNAVTKFPTSAAFLARRFCAQNVKLI